MWQHALVLLLALCNSRVAAQLNNNVVCRGIRVGDVVPNPLDCASYFVCGSQKPILHFCDGGLHFDAERKVCNWPDQANCKFGVVSIGASFVTVYPVFNLTDIKTYSTNNEFNDSTTTSDAATTTTPHFSSWDNLRLSLGAFSVTDGKPIDPLEEYNPKRIQCLHRGAYFLPHPRSCQKYYLCAFGHLLMHQCGRSTAWSYKLMQCEIANEAECYVSSEGITPITTTTTTKTTPTPNNTVSICYPVHTTINGINITTWQPFGQPTSTTWFPTGSGITQWTTAEPTKPITTGYTPTPPTHTTASTTTISTTSTTAKTTSGRYDVDFDLNCNEGFKYLADVTDCSHYFICIQGIPVGMFCPEDSYWDFKEEICTTKERVQCLNIANQID